MPLSVSMPFALVTRAAYLEYHRRRRDIEELARLGAHPLDLGYQRGELWRWAAGRIAEQQGGHWLIPTGEPVVSSVVDSHDTASSNPD